MEALVKALARSLARSFQQAFTWHLTQSIYAKTTSTVTLSIKVFSLFHWASQVKLRQ